MEMAILKQTEKSESKIIAKPDSTDLSDFVLRAMLPRKDPAYIGNTICTHGRK
jgi:hypothetical protein